MFAALSGNDKTVIGALFIAIVAPTWMSYWNARIARKQVQPNGGASLKDQMTRVEAKVDTLTIVQSLHTEQIKEIQSNQGKTNVQINTERASHVADQ